MSFFQVMYPLLSINLNFCLVSHVLNYNQAMCVWLDSGIGLVGKLAKPNEAILHE